MSEKRSDDITPPKSRLFIIGSKSLSENDYREAFQEFGDIEEIWVVKDRITGENKGVTYIKYAKTSQAARALESMNGKVIGNVGRNIKVMIAASKDQGTKRDDKETEEERTTRLFVKIPKDWDKADLLEAFKKFGNIDYANVVKDRNTNESKGFGFVKFFKFSDAAVAYEECDRDFKAVFAEPKKSSSSSRNDDSRSSSFNDSILDFSSSFLSGRSGSSSLLQSPDVGRDGYTGLLVTCSPVLTQDEVWRLFDIVPELDYCQLRIFGSGPRPAKAMASVVYHSHKWAAYALDKLQGFEFPRGMPLMIKPDYDAPPPRNSFSRNVRDDRDVMNRRDSRSSLEGRRGSSSSNSDLVKLAETLAQASNLLQAAGLSSDMLKSKLTNSEPQCNVKLPPTRPLESIDAPVAARCFIVCSPNPPPMNVLRDVFCRFGNLIDVYLLNGKNCGYAKYSVKESAMRAIEVLHGAEVCGCRIKVIEAAEQPDYKRKRARLDDSQE